MIDFEPDPGFVLLPLSTLNDVSKRALRVWELEAELREWKARCRSLTDPNPWGWQKALREARAALDRD